MECNTKSPLQWEWDNLISFGTSTTEVPRKLRPLEWEIDGLDSVSLCSPGFAGVDGSGGSGSGGPGSDLGHSFSRSSKSTSISSSSTEVKTYNFTSEAVEGLAEDLCSSEEFAKGIGTSPSLEASFGYGESVLGLKLGKRTYFEDVCAGNNAKGSTLPVSFVSHVSPEKRSKSISQSLQAPRCQVEGCNLDLSSAKDYHRKHRVCESHSKSPKVIVGGVERRFCQQCSRFHGLCEFDEKKRSCRRRLSDHNARRRKPPPEPVQLNPGRIYDGQQQVNLVWNRFALIHTRSEEKFLWEGAPSSKPIQPRALISKSDKSQSSDGWLLFDSNKLLGSTPTQQGGTGFLSPNSRISTAGFLGKDVEEVPFSSHTGGTQDLHRALSLLSNTSPWGSFEPRRVFLDRPTTSDIAPVAHHPVTATQPFALSSSSEYWQTDQPAFEPTASHRDSVSPFQLFRGPYNENYFC